MGGSPSSQSRASLAGKSPRISRCGSRRNSRRAGESVGAERTSAGVPACVLALEVPEVRREQRLRRRRLDPALQTTQHAGCHHVVRRDEHASVLLFLWGGQVLPVFLTSVRVDERSRC